MRVVLDTNVMTSALRSNRGASFAILSQLPSAAFETVVTIPLYIEYQDVLTRPENLTGRSTVEEVIRFLRYFCQISHRQDVFFLWRPWLNDPADEMVLEAAVASGSRYIVTYNERDFANIDSFGVSTIHPRDFLQLISP